MVKGGNIMHSNVSKPAIVISGLGAVTPFGSGVNALWEALLRGESAISDMDLFDLGGIACTRAGVIRNYTPPAGVAPTPRASSFAAGACHEALAQAGLLDDPEALATTALITASNFGDIDAGEPALIPSGHEGRNVAAGVHCAQASSAGRLAETFGLGGLRIALSLSCASGAAAAATAANLIAAGRAQRVLIVGYDALSRFSWSGLCSLRTMAKDIVRPFDATRNGTIFTEGAAALVIERADLCAARGAEPLAWLRGWATGNNGHHMTAPAPRGAGSTAVMRAALAAAGIAPEAVDHINMHGTGTKPNDSTETQAVQDVFGDRAASIPVTSVKGLLGHMLGAAGSVELMVSVLSLRQGIIPPTGNFTTPDPECALDVVTSPRHVALQCVLSNSAGFGGCNAAAVLTRDAPASSHATSAETPTPAPVVITGLGVISALGADAEENGASFQEQEPALFPLSRFAVPEAAEPPLAGEAPDADLAACGVAPKAYLDRASQLFLAACGMAFQKSRLDAATLASLNAGIMGGTAWGCPSTAELFFADFILKGPRLVKPFLFPHAYANTAVSLAAMEWTLKGPHENVVAHETASGVALVEAFDQLRDGVAPVIAVCGADALSGVALNARAAAGDSAPLGEAAATLVLERADAAQARGACPLGHLLGCGLAPTVKASLQAALAQAGLTPDALCAAYVNAVGRDEAEGLLPGLSVVEPALLCGDVQGATSALHLALALLARPAGPVLVLTAEPGTCVALVARPAL
ncbi:MAG TPA: beta-ketoacyl-[acyl-carrier-protein] synthase family protein [Kiritimatiellia bacterium]|nr:beta-ketoacyl-[acyl-carrier-protein] synthase family protein [Kiritimatiellia bacterium]HRU71550.1 beta-ketoacyl-[acyl-carrier-protein] synthase family protein [Kiritimatiellia bacterium]